jgi:hypothetical protein
MGSPAQSELTMNSRTGDGRTGSLGAVTLLTGTEALRGLLEAESEADVDQILIDCEAERIALRRSFEIESLGLHANFVSPFQ